MKSYEINGKDIGLYRIGEIAKAIKKSVKTLRRWEKLGLLPKPTYKSRGKRLYTKEQLETVLLWKKRHKIKQGIAIEEVEKISW